MDRTAQLFLEAMKAALENRKVTWGTEVSYQEMTGVLNLAQSHHVLPMIFEAVFACPAAAALDRGTLMQCRMSTVQAVMGQAVKTEEFLELYSCLSEINIKPLVVKGLICRELYPQPDYRCSGDEDVLCGEERFKECHKAMIRFGMEPTNPSLESYEVPYRKADGALYIELHKSLFALDSEVFKACNRLFEDAFDHPAEVTVRGVRIATLDWTQHLLYLILHAFKHFLHCGFGIRQVSDMVLFANAYGHLIDWDKVLDQCKLFRAEQFAAAIFAIGEKYLNFSAEKACYPENWQALDPDPEPLLGDLLCGGIYGSAELSRVHSCNMTLNAVEAEKKGKKGGKGSNVLRTAFPPAKQLEGRFRWLRYRPWLLPCAWLLRMCGYGKDIITRKDSSVRAVIRAGSQRVELLRTYQIID